LLKTIRQIFKLQDTVLECVVCVEGESGVNTQFGFTVTFEDKRVCAFPCSSFVFTHNTLLRVFWSSLLWQARARPRPRPWVCLYLGALEEAYIPGCQTVNTLISDKHS
jgi:hypothetical protein